MHSNALIVLHPSETTERALRDGFLRAESRSREIERIFTRFAPTSELSLLNDSGGRWFELSADMADVLRLALDLHAATAGVFDPAILPDLERAGYDRTFEDLTDDRERSTASDTPRHLFGELELRERAVRMPEGLRIDLGGIVKGWAADVLADQLYELGPVLVELGGDIAVRGTPPNGDAWQVGVEAPGKPGELLAILVVERGAVATSSTERMRWRMNGGWSHHLIDPKTREPARSDLRQVTALGDRTASTEVWAKTALILGTHACARLVADHPGLELLMVPVEGEAVATPGMIAAASALANIA